MFIKIKRWAWHPFLFALYSVLSLLANNYMYVDLESIRSLVFSLLGVIVLLMVLSLLLKSFLKAGLIASVAILLFFSFGHVENLIASWIKGNCIGITFFVGFVWFFVFVAWLIWIVKKSQKLLLISEYLNYVGIILLIFPIYSIISFSIRSSDVEPWTKKYIYHVWESAGVYDVEYPEPATLGDRPDIYYIILDAYTRSDILRALYDYDNSDFIQFLDRRGFYVAEKSRSNYADTELSLASSLNMTHINTMPEYLRVNAGVSEASTIKNIASQMICQSRVSTVMKKLGYEFVTYDSGYGRTLVQNADEFVAAPNVEDQNLPQTSFELLLLDTSVFQLYSHIRGDDYQPLQKMFVAHRERVLFTLADLPNYAEKKGDYFVFAHILSPHTPYVFGPNGEEIKNEDPYTLMDARPGKDENIWLYRNQVHYLNKLLMNTINQILEKSDTPPIIILQADHSSKVYRDANPPTSTQLKLLFPILNAYHLPTMPPALLYPEITPVNTFRILLNYYFGFSLQTMPDKSYLLESRNRQVKFFQVYEPENMDSLPSD